MATYYVKPASQGGNNSLAGTSPSTAWATVAYALSSSSGFTSGDTLYIAPGVYTDTINITIPNPTVETNIIGDPTCAQFSGFTAGPVIITNYNASLSGSGYTGNIITATTKNYLHFQNILFKIDNNRLVFTTCTYLKFTKCSFIARHKNNDIITLTSPASTAVNATITRCVFVGGNQSLNITGQSVADGTSIVDSIFINPANTAAFLNNVQVAWYNCLITGCQYGILQQPGSTTFTTTVRNCLMYLNTVDLQCVGVNNTIVENYNRLLSPTPRANCVNNGTSSSVGDIGVDFFETLLLGLNNVQPYTSYLSSPNASFGNATGAPTTDIYGVSWTGSSPDAGAGTYRVITSVPSTIGYVANLPVNTQASTITIAPGSTSQSIELYLGATGLTASTSGLSARYNRTRTASVSIPLVACTIAQAWTSGGFAEVDATNMPGVYRLDVPDAALAAGADDVTIVVRGASGTNGAVMTVKLSSGGLSSTETAQAVWNATASSYNTAGSMGEAGQKLTGYSLAASQTFSTTGSVGSVTGSVASVTGSVGSVTAPVTAGTVSDKTGYALSSSQTFSTTGSVGSVTGSVGSVTGSVGSVTGAVGSVSSAVTVGTNNDKTGYALSTAGNTASADAVWNATRSTHTTAGTFGQYVNAELVTPVSQASLVYMGPFQVIADGVTTPMPLDVQLGAQHGIAIQCVDNNLSAVSISGATVTAKVYNSGGSLVDTYACTATYAADGRATFTIDTTVTGTAGTYTATITRTTGASDTQVFGPLRIYVRDI